MSDIDITGTRCILDEKGCCTPHVIVARAHEEMSAFEFRCAECNQRRGRLPEEAVRFLRDTWRLFGPPSSPFHISGIMKLKEQKQMTRDDLFPSRYFKAIDLGGKPLVVTIKSATVESLKNMQGGNDDKLVLSFVNQKKALVCNRVNFDSISDQHGPETDSWLGKRIELYPDRTRVGGKSLDCVRVRAPIGEALNDSIPV